MAERKHEVVERWDRMVYMRTVEDGFQTECLGVVRSDGVARVVLGESVGGVALAVSLDGAQCAALGELLVRAAGSL